MKIDIENALPHSRDMCLACFRVSSLCLCSHMKKFEIDPTLILLVHPKEFMKTIGTARIVNRTITNSKLWRGTGTEFDHDPEMLSVINDPTRHCVILFPGDDSINLTTLPAEDLKTALFGDKKLTVFLLDGTWTTAKQILRESKILSVLPKVSFEVHTLSQYGFRKQPKPYCLSTVEAVHELVENLTVKGLCARPTENAHHQMLRCFQALVESQMAFELVKS